MRRGSSPSFAPILVVQAERLSSFDENPSPPFPPFPPLKKDPRTNFWIALYQYSGGSGDPVPRPDVCPRCRPSPPKMPVLARLRGLQPGNGGRHRAGVSTNPTICRTLFPASLSLGRSRRWFLGPFFSRGKGAVKGSCRSFPVVQLARPI